MNLSMKWLSDFVDVNDIGIEEYVARMTDTGSKVEGFERLFSEIKNVVVGKIEKITKHPDADKLQICMLNVGKDEPIQIVTGAQNVFEYHIATSLFTIMRRTQIQPCGKQYQQYLIDYAKTSKERIIKNLVDEINDLR